MKVIAKVSLNTILKVLSILEDVIVALYDFLVKYDK